MRWLIILAVAVLIGGYVVQTRKPAPEVAEAPAPEPPRPTAAEVLAEHGLDERDRLGASSGGNRVNRGISGHLRDRIGGQMRHSEQRSERN